jgi:hypothetical protein
MLNRAVCQFCCGDGAQGNACWTSTPPEPSNSRCYEFNYLAFFDSPVLTSPAIVPLGHGTLFRADLSRFAPAAQDLS